MGRPDGLEDDRELALDLRERHERELSTAKQLDPSRRSSSSTAPRRMRRDSE
jgi:hypothetical protein